MILGDTRLLGSAGMLNKHLVFTMHRHEVLRLDQIEHQLLLFLRRMTSCMERCQRGIYDDIGTDSGQLVDNCRDTGAIARNRIAGEQHCITRNNLDEAVSAIGNTRQSSHRLTLGTCAYNTDLVSRQGIELVAGNEGRIRNFDRAKLLADLTNIFHGAAKYRNLASAADGCFQNLVQTQHVGGKGGYQQSARCLAHLFIDRLGNLLFGNGEARYTGVGGITHQQCHTDLADICHLLIVRINTNRRQVKLEVTGLDNAAVWRIDQDTVTVRNRVDNIEEADVEVLGINARIRIDVTDGNTAQLMVFFQLLFNQSLGKRSSIDLSEMHGLQEERDAADMVFMAMGNNQSLDLFTVFDKVGIVRNDIVYSQQVVFGEQNAAVDNDNLVIVFEAVHVLADFAKTAQSIHKRISLMIDRLGCLFRDLGVTNRMRRSFRRFRFFHV